MSRAKIEVIDTGNIGIYADFGSESEDEHECDRQAIEKEDEEIRDFVSVILCLHQMMRKETNFGRK